MIAFFIKLLQRFLPAGRVLIFFDDRCNPLAEPFILLLQFGDLSLHGGQLRG